MDIHLKESSLDGIEIAEQFNKICRVPILYLSSFYDIDTRNRAKKTNPVNYLLKPWTSEQLDVALDIALGNYLEQAHSGNSDFKNKGHFFIKNGTRYVRYDEADILWVQGGGYGSSIEIYTNSERIIFSSSLQDFERQLSTNNLIRVHRSYLVNVNHIHATERERLILIRQGKETYIPISKEYTDIQKYLVKIRSI
jgi:DNA-binding LytR/AlgR family response regulator